MDQSMGDKLQTKVDYNERILSLRADGDEISATDVDMAPFYTIRGDIMLRPAFTEYVALHQNSLNVVDAAAESYITRSLDLSRGGRRRSERIIRLSHRWNLIRRLFGVEIMSFEQLTQLARLTEGGTRPREVSAS
jgi:hypothetical protein